MHTQNETMAQGTAFAIAYSSDITAFGLEDLVVFSVLEHTPWHTEAIYSVPAAVPACPEGGCTCAYLWVPHGCGQPNIYMQGFKCMVTGATSKTPVAKAQPPKMCTSDPSSCVSGSKQTIVWNQMDGNNVDTTGTSDTPAYNERCGFKPGAQDDIFEGAPLTPSNATTTGGPGSSTTADTTIQTSALTSSTDTGFFMIQTKTDLSVTATPTVPTQVAATSDSSSSALPSFPGDNKPPVSKTESASAPLETMPSFTDAPSSVAPTGTSPISFTSSWTGRMGKPMKFTCYAEEE